MKKKIKEQTRQTNIQNLNDLTEEQKFEFQKALEKELESRNMKEYIDKLKEIETLVELSIGTTMTEDKAKDIYAVTNDLMFKVKKLNIPAVMQRSEQLISLLERLLENNMCSPAGDELIEALLKEINCA
jgi:hypothetical protein